MFPSPQVLRRPHLQGCVHEEAQGHRRESRAIGHPCVECDCQAAHPGGRVDEPGLFLQYCLCCIGKKSRWLGYDKCVVKYVSALAWRAFGCVFICNIFVNASSFNGLPPAHKTFAHQCRPCSPGPEKHVEKHADPLICTFQNDVVKKRIQLCPRMYKALTDCGKLQCVETVPMCGSVVAREKMFCSKCKTAISCQWCSKLGTSSTLESKRKNRHVLICSYVGMGTKCLLVRACTCLLVLASCYGH